MSAGERGQDMAMRLSRPPSPPAYCVFQLWNDEVDKVSSCGVGRLASLWLWALPLVAKARHKP